VKEGDTMSVYQEAVDCLKQMHSIIRANNLDHYGLTRETYLSLIPNERQALDRNIKFMLEESWIAPYALCAGFPVSYSLTSTGIKIAEDITQDSFAKQTNYTIGTVHNSIVGDNAHDNIINVEESQHWYFNTSVHF
jgi:hypothetical protein